MITRLGEWIIEPICNVNPQINVFTTSKFHQTLNLACRNFGKNGCRYALIARPKNLNYAETTGADKGLVQQNSHSPTIHIHSSHTLVFVVDFVVGSLRFSYHFLRISRVGYGAIPTDEICVA